MQSLGPTLAYEKIRYLTYFSTTAANREIFVEMSVNATVAIVTLRFAPVIVNWVPPDSGPYVGRTPTIDGAGARDTGITKSFTL